MKTKHGTAIYGRIGKGKGPRYITLDRDAHSGGAWKGANKPLGLESKSSRTATYDINLKKIGK